MELDVVTLPDGTPVPAAALTWAFSRSGGPGGQNVNKVNTKVELRVTLAALPETVASRLREKYPQRIDTEDRIIVVSNRFREQLQNRKDALAKFLALVEEALRFRKKRYATRAPASVEYKRLEEKKSRARIKRLRRTSPGEE